MVVQYNPKTDLLYLRIDAAKQQVINKQIAGDIVLDIGKDDRIVGIEILDASRKVDLKSFLPVNYLMEEVS
jgi:uncharacterized protein YuzE